MIYLGLFSLQPAAIVSYPSSLAGKYFISGQYAYGPLLNNMYKEDDFFEGIVDRNICIDSLINDSRSC